ncbi:hypothetical protein [Pseudoxanthomonas koreensis]|uniref:hypothetical protein n=1 Tax=Pseudoxanthomonas koreensis TaxID=266061 RepID=UPI001391170E|nr:hypothetical protein [Pseudoxanthomonas koreensis]
MSAMLHAANTANQACQSGWSKKRHVDFFQKNQSVERETRMQQSAVRQKTGVFPCAVLRCAQPRGRQPL